MENEKNVSPKFHVTEDMLQRCLYMRKEVRPLDIRQYASWTLNKVSFQISDKASSCQKITRALETFPPEVRLCTSGVPGHLAGVCARMPIPAGTWVGPYAGRRVLPGAVKSGDANAYMWEVCHEGRLAHYIDGSDEDSSSWMRFIRCARNKQEQNLFAFQYLGSIYYRAFKDIAPGTELLVWYDEINPQYMGIPLELRDMIGAEFSPSSDVMRNEGSAASVIPLELGILTTPHALSSQPLKRGYDPLAQLQVQEFEHAHKRKRVSWSDSEDVSPIGGEAGDEIEDSGRDAPEVKSQFEEAPSSIFRCGQCGKAFAQKSVLQVHVCTRMANKPYQCGYCGLSFNNPTELRAHAVSHCSEKPFKCGYCSRSFSGATTLNNHIRTHTGEKPFRCDSCGKSFSQGSQLSRHQRSGDCSDDRDSI
ncbi:putative histone-lysine N-methyltransferase PRDM6 isoform X2 [Nematostella vectensis]|nr:putative histone-lysine N-methyltransferase PRDM6 isoform X2 [Nematostella vectensis]